MKNKSALQLKDFSEFNKSDYLFTKSNFERVLESGFHLEKNGQLIPLLEIMLTPKRASTETGTESENTQKI